MLDSRLGVGGNLGEIVSEGKYHERGRAAAGVIGLPLLGDPRKLLDMSIYTKLHAWVVWGEIAIDHPGFHFREI